MSVCYERVHDTENDENAEEAPDDDGAVGVDAFITDARKGEGGHP